MSKLSRAIKYQRRQKALKKKQQMEKEMRNSIWLTDTESVKKGNEATFSEARDFVNGNNSLRPELSGIVNKHQYGVSYEEGMKMPLTPSGFALQSLMEARLHELQMKNPDVRIVVHDNGKVLC